MGVSFSALLSVYRNDKGKALDECLESLYNQTEQLDEIVIVQEGDVAPDLTATLQKWSGIFAERFSWYKLPFQNGPMGFGLPKCLNYGIEQARSQYLMRLDTDDVCLPNRVEVQKKFATANPDVKLFGCFIQEFNEELTTPMKMRRVPVSHEAIVKRSRLLNPFNGQTVVFDRETALKLGGYPNIPSNEDYGFWALFLLGGYKTANIGEVLVHVRAGEGLLHRRSSKRYRKGEVVSLKYLRSIRFFTPGMYAFHRLARGFVRALPTKLIAMTYHHLLRSK